MPRDFVFINFSYSKFFPFSGFLGQCSVGIKIITFFKIRTKFVLLTFF
jgi:hypothetical protein